MERADVEEGTVTVDDAGNITIGIPTAIVHVDAPPVGGEPPDDDEALD